MKLKPGQALASAVDTTQIVVVRAPADDEVELTCGGAPMVAKGTEPTGAEIAPAHRAGSILGKRYVDAAGTLELLCTKGGDGSLAASGTPLTLATAKPLPASD